MNSINFFFEYPSFNHPSEKNLINWLYRLAKNLQLSINEINIIFCDDEYLLKINQQYLNHDTYTDIITFDYLLDEPEKQKSELEGDIFISIDRIKENTDLYNSSFYEELIRVIAHGTLHLAGFKDKTEMDEKEMRYQEQQAIKIWYTDNN